MSDKLTRSPLGQLLDTLPGSGTVTWIGIRPERKMPVLSVDKVEAIAGKGLKGDHYKGMATSTRHVTLIQDEHLATVASFMQASRIDPGLLRRNIVVKGINLLALKDKRFLIGTALLEMTGLCHPCSRMEQQLGAGGYNAMRGHGGITARIIEGGHISVGDLVTMQAAVSGK